MTEKTIKIANIVVTVVTLAASAANVWLSDKDLDLKVEKAVAKALNQE